MDVINDVNRMWNALIPGHGFADRIGGELGKEIKKNGYETCASQLSYAMNRTGFRIANTEMHLRPNLVNPHPLKGEVKGQPRSLLGGDGMRYIFSVLDMIVYLEGKHKIDRRIGKMENIKSTPTNMEKAVIGRHGIIAFGIRHIDLWTEVGNEGKWSSKHYKLFDHKSAILRGIFFWEFKDRYRRDDELDQLLEE